jgi:hypothetical protein
VNTLQSTLTGKTIPNDYAAQPTNGAVLQGKQRNSIYLEDAKSAQRFSCLKKET